MPGDMDPSLIQDFLTEASELIEQLDVDLVKLEHTQGQELTELLNGSFRALHTIKGAASFLSLTSITTFAHAAEDALNRLRKGDVAITPNIMDAMLQSADVVRNMIIQLGEGQNIDHGPGDLITQLHDIAKLAAHGCKTTAADAATALPKGATKMDLPPEKADLLPFMMADLDESVQKMAGALSLAGDSDARAEMAQEVAKTAADILKTADFFALDGLGAIYQVVAAVAGELANMADNQLDEMVIRLQAVCHLTQLQSAALEHALALSWPCDLLLERIGMLADGQPLDEAIVGAHDHDVTKLLQLDGVLSVSITNEKQNANVKNALQAATSESADHVSQAATQAVAQVVAQEDSQEVDITSGGENTEAVPKAQAQSQNAPQANTSKGPSLGEATIRVEVERLESLLNLVGQLVLSKNRFLALSRKLRDHESAAELNEEMTGAASDLDRLTSELQMGVMRTRMQPLAKLFDRYPRVIRDVARMTGKQINLELQGKDTEVDKSVLELLADPLVHILRNSADHGVESIEQRKSNGKTAQGTIRLVAEHQGSHVRVEISDDGKGMDRKVIGEKAVEKGLATPAQVEAMSDEEVFKFIFSAGFSTAAAVTNLSGRGVGMDVVRTNVNKMNGEVTVQSVKGKGTTVEILIPLTVAILSAMVVGVGEHLYAVPLTCIVEIVRPEAQAMHTVAGKPVMTLRESVLPLIDLHARLGEPRKSEGSRFAVVVAVGSQQAGLMVDRLIGQQEVVIKPLDDRYTSGGPFSGATIREDGDVSLILDVIQLVRQAQGSAKPERTAAEVAG